MGIFSQARLRRRGLAESQALSFKFPGELPVEIRLVRGPGLAIIGQLFVEVTRPLLIHRSVEDAGIENVLWSNYHPVGIYEGALE